MIAVKDLVIETRNLIRDLLWIGIMLTCLIMTKLPCHVATDINV